MNQLEYKYVDEHLISSSLVCPICLDILEDPYTHVQCDSAFCRSCLLKLDEPICPICRWHWDDELPIEYNCYLPRSSRLIRNMLDELRVQCLQCHTIRYRGQFDHECQSLKILPPMKSEPQENNVQMILFVLVLFLFIFFIYSYHTFIFERAVDRRDELIHDIGIDIDKYLYDKMVYLIGKFIEYSTPVIIFSLSLWACLIFYGDRFISKTTSQIMKELLEILIVINLIVHSIYY